MQYDYVLIAVYDFTKIKEINEQLLQMGISSEKIKAIALEQEFIDVFMDQRMYWIRDYAKWTYEQRLEGNVAECGVFRGDSAKYINSFSRIKGYCCLIYLRDLMKMTLNMKKA